MGNTEREPEKSMSQLPSDVLLGDLDALFCAVTARLRQIADSPVEATATSVIDANDRIRAGVLECATALDQLHEMLAHEIERRRRLEQIVTDAQAALAHAPPELVAVLGVALRVPPISRLLTRAPGLVRAT